jgi:hypothetical protein
LSRLPQTIWMADQSANFAKGANMYLLDSCRAVFLEFTVYLTGRSGDPHVQYTVVAWRRISHDASASAASG